MTSGVVGDAYQLVKSGIGKVTRSFDRARGLKLLNNLPRGLEALVYGEDVTPELLAALSLGGRPGLQLSTIALMKANKKFYVRDKHELSTEFGTYYSDYGDYHGGAESEDERIHDHEQLSGETCLNGYFQSADDVDDHRSLMDGGQHNFMPMPDGSVVRNLRIPPPDASLSLTENAHVVVVGFTFDHLKPVGLLAVGEADGLGYCCENHSGQLKLSAVDTNISVSPRAFIVAPRVLENYRDFRRLLSLLELGKGFVPLMLGLTKVAKELGEEFVRQIAGGRKPLLSFEHVKSIHCELVRDTPTLKMPTDAELETRIEEATDHLSLCERDVELVLYDAMKEIISDYVKAVETEAALPGHVGVRPYRRKWESDLIASCIVQAVGMDANFAIFEHFSKSKLNIAVSPGCTAMYFPGLALTVAFPEGFEVQSVRMVLAPPCPFNEDFQESLPILCGLARKLAVKSCRQFAKTLSLELAKNPAVALSPVSEVIRRALTPGGIRCEFYLTKLFASLDTWGEASVAGILCQLGLHFSVPPGGEDLRCFFEACRMVWPSRGSGAVVFVDCGVDISRCLLDTKNERFLSSSDMLGFRFYLTGQAANVRWDKLQPLQQCVGSLRCKRMKVKYTNGIVQPRPRRRIPIPCHIIGTLEN